MEGKNVETQVCPGYDHYCKGDRCPLDTYNIDAHTENRQADIAGIHDQDNDNGTLYTGEVAQRAQSKCEEMMAEDLKEVEALRT